MAEGLLLALALLSSLCGMAWFALANKAHWRQVRGEVPLHGVLVKRLRVLGATCLLVAFVLCLQADAPSMAVLVWVMSLALGALAVALALAWWPALLRPFAAALNPRSAPY